MRGIRFALAARTAAALLAALALTFATDREAGASPVPDRAADRILLPSAGWNGRPIQAPHRHDVVRTSAAGSRCAAGPPDRSGTARASTAPADRTACGRCNAAWRGWATGSAPSTGCSAA